MNQRPVPDEVARLKEAIKSEDGLIATYFTSRISIQIVRVLGKTRVTPNQVTLFSVLVVALCGYLFMSGRHLYYILGAILLQFYFVLDCVDGELARFKRLGSAFGTWLDQISDRISEFLIFAGLCIGEYRTTGDITIWVWGLAAFFSVYMFYYVTTAVLPATSGAHREDLIRKIRVYLQERKVLVGKIFLSVFNRDTQMFYISVGVALNRVKILFVFLIVLGSIMWILHSYLFWRRGLPRKET